MRFHAVLLLIILTAFVNTTIAQSYQKTFATTGLDYTHSGFTTLRDSGIAIITVSSSMNSDISIVKLNKQGNIQLQRKIKLPTDFTCETWTPVIMEVEQGALMCSFSYTGTFNKNGVLIFKVDASLNLLWNRYVPGTPQKHLNPMTRCGSKYYTVTRLLKNDPSGLDPHIEYGYTLSCISTNGDLVWGRTFLSDSSNFYEMPGVFTNGRNNLVVTSGQGTLPIQSGLGARYYVYNEVDTNGNVIQCKSTTGIVTYSMKTHGANQYLVSGLSNGFPFVGILDNNFTTVWMKRLLIPNETWSGMAYVKTNEIYFHTTYGADGISIPLLVKLDMNGQVLETYVMNDTVSSHYSAKLTAAGKHAVVSVNQGAPLGHAVKVRVSDDATGAPVCPGLLICNPIVESMGMSMANYIYRKDTSFAMDEFTITTPSASIALQNYCNPVEPLNAFFAAADDTICAGQNMTFQSDPTWVMGTSSWVITGPTGMYAATEDITFNFSQPGIYTVMHYHHVAHCSDTFSRTVVATGEVPPAIVTICDTVYKNQLTTGCDITWPDGSHGNYYVPPASGPRPVQLSCGNCVTIATVVFEKTKPSRLQPNTFSVCESGGSVYVAFTSSGYTNIVWQDGHVGLSRTITEAGIYPVRIFNSNACSIVDTVYVTAIKPDATFELQKDTVCVNEAFDLISMPQVSDSDSYWMVTGPYGENFPAKDVKELKLPYAGTYTIWHRHTIGYCVHNNVKKITVKGASASTEVATCDTVFASDISTGCSVQWNDGSAGSYFVPDGLDPYVHVIVGCDGCFAPFDVLVKKLPHPHLPDRAIEICAQQNYRYIIPQNFAQSAIWQDGTNTLSYPIDTAGTYVVSMYNGYCSAVDTLTVTTLDCNGCSVYIPNVFTPNGDNANDIFTTYNNCPLVVQYQLQVYNRYGEKVFESLDAEKGWNGEYKGSPSPQDVYVYVLQIITTGSKDFETKNYKGSFTLLR